MSKSWSMVRSAWKDLWRDNKWEVVRSMLTLLRDRPIALFVLTVTLIHFHWFSILLIPIIFLFNQFLIEIFIKGDVLATTFQVIRAGMHLNQRLGEGLINAKKYLVSDYLSWQYNDIDKYFLKKFSGLFGIRSFSVNNTVYVYHIKSQNFISTNLTCYATPILRSYIFFNESPQSEISAFQRFSFLHELAHACLKFTSGSPFASHGLKIYAVYFAFLAVYVDWHIIPVWVLIALGVILTMAWVERVQINRNKRLHDEIEADSFALGYLAPAERETMYKLKSYLNLSNDNQLDFKQNRIRMEALSKHIDLAKDGAEDTLLESTYSLKYKPGYLLVVFTCAVALLPSFYVSSLGGWSFFSLFLLTTLLLTIFLFVHFLIDILDNIITKKLQEWEVGYQDDVLLT